MVVGPCKRHRLSSTISSECFWFESNTQIQYIVPVFFLGSHHCHSDFRGGEGGGLRSIGRNFQNHNFPPYLSLCCCRTVYLVLTVYFPVYFRSAFLFRSSTRFCRFFLPTQLHGPAEVYGWMPPCPVTRATPSPRS